MKRTISIAMVLVALSLIGTFLVYTGKKDSAAESVEIDALKSLPYAEWSAEEADPESSGVVRHDGSSAFNGYNIYTDDARYAYLMDMEGRIVHKWEFPPIEGKWEDAECLPDGGLLALCVKIAFVKLARNSDIDWQLNLRAHHDIEILEDGSYLVPFYPKLRIYNQRMVYFDSIAHVSEAGKFLGSWSTYEHFDELRKLHGPTPFEKSRDEYSTPKNEVYEYYHLNTVEALPDTPLGRRDGRFQEGNILTCLRNVSLILIIDRKSGRIAWSYGPGELDWPHMPTMLENGNILIFDNGVHRNYSRIVEIEPTTGTIAWEYKADPPESFYSKWRGSNQRLPNGNTFICESERGRAFEVTPDGEIVWEFFNPEISGGKRRLIYRMTRLSREEVEGWLDR